MDLFLKSYRLWSKVGTSTGNSILGNTTYIIYVYIIEGSLEVKLPTIWTVEKQR
jgi:hypothetical protein